jgi:hypothetical protein
MEEHASDTTAGAGHEKGLTTEALATAGETEGAIAPDRRREVVAPERVERVEPAQTPGSPPPVPASAESQDAKPQAQRADGANHDAPPAGRSSPLLVAEEAGHFRSRWDEIQTRFVDAPRQSVEEADHLVAEAIKRIAEAFAAERKKLEQQWSRGEDVSTEDLRIALQRYRGFFSRLLET